MGVKGVKGCKGVISVHAMAINVCKTADHGGSGHHLEVMGTPHIPTFKSGHLHIIVQ